MRSLALGGIVFLASLIVSTFLAEGLLRLLFPHPQPQFLKLDKLLGHSHRPGVKGYFTKEGTAFVDINSHGFRDDEYTKTKATNQFRIAVLGDSYTEALQVELTETYHSLLEARYQNLEVLNFGVSGYGTTQSLLLYINKVETYNPDVVVLSFYPGNDLLDNSKVLSGDYPRPYLVEKDDQLFLDDSFLEDGRFTRADWVYSLYFWLTDNFLLASYLDRVRHVRFVDEAIPAQGENSHIVYNPTSELHLQAWRITEKLILELKKEVESGSARFVLFVLDSLPEQSNSESPLYTEQRLKELCIEHDVVCGFMGESALKTDAVSRLHGFDGSGYGHWNQRGHILASEILEHTLRENSILPAPNL